MAANLRDRLKWIQEQKRNEKPKEIQYVSKSTDLTEKGWEPCGFNVLKRDVTVNAPLNVKSKLPEALSIIIPDLRNRKLPVSTDFLFFDLETTGLSGGAGTVAFLAAFGRFEINNMLIITQYLLLDYPGENDFLEAVLKEFKNKQSVIVSYNGKCFDSQILKTRCLMNSIKPPEYLHADLLHPARRLWKNIIHDCSQGSIETRILGLDRSDDIPGALAPEIWFEFLKTGRTERLLGICDHNRADIEGLASILSAMISIAAAPVAAEYRYDIGRLALYWRDFNRRERTTGELLEAGDRLLRIAAEKRNPRAVYVYAFDQMRNGNYEEAIKFVELGLELFEDGTVWNYKLLRRKERLERKMRTFNH
ncbi:MAG: ribonuclease H-like domain-containing protein [Treponema sp.]|jgi:uncharacterized protein YprB with RNaseH-like and TPR domain|nr:ribonuclease H-like domain-containing protein [Treponema sp.]